jgi:hypothetical protein
MEARVLAASSRRRFVSRGAGCCSVLAALARAHLRQLRVPALELGTLAGRARPDVARMAAGLARFDGVMRLGGAVEMRLHDYSFSLDPVIGIRAAADKP